MQSQSSSYNPHFHSPVHINQLLLVTVSVYVPANICCHKFQLLPLKTLFNNHISAISSLY